LRVDVGAEVMLVVEHAQEGRGVVPLSSEGETHIRGDKGGEKIGPQPYGEKIEGTHTPRWREGLGGPRGGSRCDP